MKCEYCKLTEAEILKEEAVTPPHECHFCGTTSRPLTSETIPIPATNQSWTGYVCDDPKCQSRLAIRKGATS